VVNLARILKNGLIYLHIPKTGGNWLTKVMLDQKIVIDKIGHKHASYDALLGNDSSSVLMRHKLKKFRYFCVVRHPLHWYESWFKYQTSRGWLDWGEAGNPADWHVMAEMNRNKSEDFNTFMRLVNKNTPGFVHQLFGSYTNGSNAYILKNETVALDFVALCGKLEINIDKEAVLRAPAYGVSPDLSISWEKEVLEETLENELPAFRRYNYHHPHTLRH